MKWNCLCYLFLVKGQERENDKLLTNTHQGWGGAQVGMVRLGIE